MNFLIQPTYPEVSYLYGVGVGFEKHLDVFNVFLSLRAWLGHLISCLTSSVFKLKQELKRTKFSHTLTTHIDSKTHMHIHTRIFISPMGGTQRDCVAVGRPMKHQNLTDLPSPPEANTASSYSVSSIGP